MSKKEKFRIELDKELKKYLEIHEKQSIVDYFINKSNLPGHRANLELANAFVNISGEFNENLSKVLWDLCLYLISFDANKAPTNNPKEFLSFCGTWAIGAIGASHPKYYHESLALLKKLSTDLRWRMREAVAFGLQKLLINYPYDVLTEIKQWIDDENWLTMRAVAAGVANPSVLINDKISEMALEFHEFIFSKIISSNDFSSEEFKILKKGLSYTLSVIVQAYPDKGFKFLKNYIDNKNKHIQKIIKENLKKNRLTKNFPREVASIR